MNIKGRGREKKIFLIALACLLVLSSAYVIFALQAFPGGSTQLAGQLCSATNRSLAVSCRGTYPGACGAAGDRIGCVDGINESHGTAGNGQIAALNITYYNSSVDNCQSVNEVFICYKRAVTGSSTISACEVSVDADNWASASVANATCPAIGPQQPLICNNVTASESWTCGNFFGSTGTRAVARVKIAQNTGSGTRSLNVDALFFNVTYTADSFNPNIDLVYPSEISGTYAFRNWILVNLTATDANLKNLSIFLYNSTRALINSTNSTTSPLYINFTGLTNGIYYFNATAYDLAGNVNYSETRNVTLDTINPSINFTSPTPVNNSMISVKAFAVNLTSSDTNYANITIYLYNSTYNAINTTFSNSNNLFINFTNLFHGRYYFNATAYDLAGNVNYTETREIFVNRTASLGWLDAIPSIISGGQTILMNATGIAHTNNESLQFFCSNVSQSPTSSNTICAEGSTSSSFPYPLTCSFIVPSLAGTYEVFCRVYDGEVYSTTKNKTYTVSTSIPATSIVSVAGDSTPSYFDTVNDGRTNITVSGDMNLTCRWASSDLAYSGMGNPCINYGAYSNCSISDVLSQGFYTRYISCADNATGANGQNTSQNLDVAFYLDYTAPTTSDNSVSTIKIPNYTITITETDNVDLDPLTYYCTSSSLGCNPTTLIDNGGIITYTSSNRGVNYLRYYSIDFAGNTQTIVNKTININQLPVFTSAADNAVTIKGGTTINVSTVAYDSDSDQTLTLLVCSNSGANYSQCTNGHYCNSTGSANISCTFTSESDSASHNWYAYIFDSLNESAAANPITGSYVTDVTSPILSINFPFNQTYYTNSIFLSLILNENASSAYYSIDGNANVSLTGSAAYWSGTVSISNGNHNIIFYANDSSGNLANSSKIYFSIVDATPKTIIQTQTIYEGGGGGQTTTVIKEGSESITYDKEIEILSEEEGEFSLEVYNTYANSILENLTLFIKEVFGENISIVPDKISKLSPGEMKQFNVKFHPFNYSDYSEYNLNAIIKGRITKGGISKNYTESKLIKLVVQSISKKEAEKRLSEAQEAILEMREANLSTFILEQALNQSNFWLNEKKVYPKSWKFSDQIVKTKEIALEADNLLRRLILSIENPRDNNLIGSNVVKNFGSFSNEKPLKSLFLTGQAVLTGNSIGNLVGQAIMAFDKGDYYTALAIAKEAQDSLLSERSNNPMLFVYAYWPFILLALFFIFAIGIFSSRMRGKSLIVWPEESIAYKFRRLFKNLGHNASNPFRGLALKGKKEIMIVDHYILDILKSISNGKDLKGKTIKINLN